MFQQATTTSQKICVVIKMWDIQGAAAKLVIRKTIIQTLFLQNYKSTILNYITKLTTF